MKRKIAFLFCVIIIVFCKENYAKYIVEQTILIAEINIDTIFPEIELISITETPEKEQYKVNFQIKVVENNIKINKFKSFDFDSYQDVPFVSYPQAEGYTRIVEYKKLTNQNVKDKTTISIEYPQQYVQHVNQPYYPIINEENLALYEKYKRQADKYDNLFVCGR